MMRSADSARKCAAALSTRASGMPQQAIREVMELAWARPSTIHLEVGEPDFATPSNIVEAAHRAALEGHTRYSPNAGIPELRAALAAKLQRVNGYTVDPSQVVVCNGGVQALHATLLTLTDPGDEVLLPDPGWPDFAQMVTLVNARPRFYQQTAHTGFLPSVEELEQLLTPATRVLVVNSPSNPLGAVIPRELAVELVAFAERHDLWLISDECYDEMTFDGPSVSPMAVAPSPRIISIYSFSKVYAMTGWRVGYAVACKEVAALLTRVQEPLISCVNAPAQLAALAAVTDSQDVVIEMRDAYRLRRDRAIELLAGSRVALQPPAGAFYLWLDISCYASDSAEFVRGLIDDQAVAAAPGTAFGAAGAGFVRLSLAASLEDLLEGIRRLTRYGAQISDEAI